MRGDLMSSFVDAEDRRPLNGRGLPPPEGEAELPHVDSGDFLWVAFMPRVRHRRTATVPVGAIGEQDNSQADLLGQADDCRPGGLKVWPRRRYRRAPPRRLEALGGGPRPNSPRVTLLVVACPARIS